jgi:AraC-like DNA-binding protein/quercetin dioxygenase-like cupin family protein
MPSRPSPAPVRSLSRVGPQTPHLYGPTAARPLRAKVQRLTADTHVVPHRHPWGQLAFSTVGVVRLTADHGTYLAPPSRAVWVPPGIEHAITVIEDTELRTLYLLAPPGRTVPMPVSEQLAWTSCRVLEVSDLLRALVIELDTRADGAGPPLSHQQRRRERLLSALVLDELRRARPLPMGVDLPADKRLRALCEAVLDDPARHATLDGWASDSGASSRTVARLFRQQLGTTFGQWRQRVLLAKALALAAGHHPMNRIASELGYASPSAFSAMVRRSVGQAPSRFFASEA